MGGQKHCWACRTATTTAHTGIDELLRQGLAYRDSGQFQEMIQFLAKFRDYSPFNNLLVWTQRPGCRLFATRSKWEKKFKRRVVEDARPMVILAPRTPVLLVYDVDQTDGPPLPAELEEFAQFRGELGSAVDRAHGRERGTTLFHSHRVQGADVDARGIRDRGPTAA